MRLTSRSTLHQQSFRDDSDADEEVVERCHTLPTVGFCSCFEGFGKRIGVQRVLQSRQPRLTKTVVQMLSVLLVGGLRDGDV